ncbi:MAG: tRNA (N6-threonylcarbamoyladenosine(37)-N6)-methyltransferase TrmO [Anaerolineae bacterium]
MSKPQDPNPKSQGIALSTIGYVRRDECDEGLKGLELRARPARVVLNPAVTDGLLGLVPGDDVIVLCYFHKAERDVLQVHPMGDMEAPLRGVFATRSPARPNPIAVTSARIELIEENVLHVVGLDALDGTPVVDVKSYAEAFDTPYGAPTQDIAGH